LIALMCLSTATAMFMGAGFKRLMAQRTAGQAAAPAKEEKHTHDSPSSKG
jgi:hypothetical protein